MDSKDATNLEGDGSASESFRRTCFLHVWGGCKFLVAIAQRSTFASRQFRTITWSKFMEAFNATYYPKQVKE